MFALFEPAVFVINRLKYLQKFLLISALFSLPLGLLLYFFLAEINDRIAFGAKERAGVEYICTTRGLIRDLQVLRGASYSSNPHLHTFTTTKETSTQQIDQDIHNIDRVDKRLGEALATSEKWWLWKANWDQFQKKAPQLTKQEHFDRCTKLIAQALSLVAHVGDTSHLTVDPDLDSYYLMDSTVNRLFALTELMGHMRGQHSAFLAGEGRFSQEKGDFWLGQATKELEAIQHNFRVAVDVNPSLQAAFDPGQQTLNQTFGEVASLTGNADRDKSTPQSAERKADQVFACYTRVIEAAFQQHEVSARTLDALLQQRIRGFQGKRTTILVFIGIAVTLVVYIWAGFYLSIRRMAAHLAEATDRLVSGEKAQVVSLQNRDEMAQVATSFNQICLALQKTADELNENNANLEQIVVERTRQMEYQAFHDALTGLPNRILFRNRLEFAIDKASRQPNPLAVIFIDLDNFKLINDSLGHDAGDQLLLTIAQRLKGCVRPGDTVARLGGDEFILLLEDLHCEEDADQVACRILQSWRIPLILDGKEIYATGSIGIAFSPDGRTTSDMLMRDADTAMYHAKSHGKADYVRFDPHMNQDARERMEIENGLRVALERGELCVYYQPLVDLRTGLLIGAEALLRWQHPERGLITPGIFLAIAEDTGLIVAIGYWIMEQACLQARAWIDQFPEQERFIINVNLSGKQIQRVDLVERVQDVLKNTGLDPQNLKLEITESVIMEDVEGTVAKLRQLKDLGVKLALDDFGTGYSSMASLSAFPIDTVKIDKSFVQRMSAEEETASIVAAMISLSKALNLHVTGEGIETQDHVTQLQVLGCDTGQGYYFAQPLTCHGMSEKMADHTLSFVKSIEESNREIIEALLRAA